MELRVQRLRSFALCDNVVLCLRLELFTGCPTGMAWWSRMWGGDAPRSRSVGSLPQHDTGPFFKILLGSFFFSGIGF
eukprot:4700303-Amphidinium_carterae.1